MTVKHVVVFGLDDFNRALLKTIRNADGYVFHDLLDQKRFVERRDYPMDALLEEARRALDELGVPPDAIIGHFDFPVSTTLPILRRERGLPGPSLESVLKCEHKYWSRLEQSRALGGVTPRFCALDPFAAEPLASVDLPFPFWLKPVKSFSSYLGFRIGSRRDFQRAIAEIRAGIGRIAEPFNVVLGQAEIPPEIGGIDGFHCVAEEIVAGRQCTLEGYVLRGQARVYGIVDSKRGPNRISFARYEYPSTLPRSATEEMIEQACRFVTFIGLDDTPFDVEFLYREKDQSVRLLEVNPRISKSHAPLFLLVEGASHHEVAVEVALGLEPNYPRGQGLYRRAGKFMVRKYGDAIVTRSPSAEELAGARERVPGAWIEVRVQAGMRLSELRNQDSYSYEIAVVYVGANSRRELLDKYRRLMEVLPFGFSDGGVISPTGAHPMRDEEEPESAAA